MNTDLRPMRSTPSMLFNIGGKQGKDAAQLMREYKNRRSPPPGSRVVEVAKPLGLEFANTADGNVIISAINPRGNAGLLQRDGKIAVGDLVVMCSATFGKEVWSCLGSGKDRLMTTIRTRQGSVVTLVLESQASAAKEAARAKKEKSVAEAKGAKEDDLKDKLLDEIKTKKKKFSIWGDGFD